MSNDARKKELSLDELVELARLQEEKEKREKVLKERVEFARAKSAEIAARQKAEKINTGAFYKEMQEMKAFGVRLQTGVNHDIELIEL